VSTNENFGVPDGVHLLTNDVTFFSYGFLGTLSGIPDSRHFDLLRPHTLANRDARIPGGVHLLTNGDDMAHIRLVISTT